MKKIYLFFLSVLFCSFSIYSQSYHSISGGPFFQNWSDTSLITFNNEWFDVPSIIGYRGDNLTTVTGATPDTLLSDGNSTPVNVIANQANPNTNATGGIAEFEITNPVVAFQGSGTADAPFIIIYLNTTGTSNIRVRYTLRDIDGSADNAFQSVALQYRIGNSGNFTNIPAAYVPDATTGGAATLETNIDVNLPAVCENQSQVQLRIITTNAVGNDEWVGIDDINIGVSAPSTTVSVSAGINAVEPSTNGTFNINLSNPAPAGGVIVSYTYTGPTTGTATLNSDYTDSLSGSISIPEGSTSTVARAMVIDDITPEPTETIIITLTGATNGFTINTATATISLLDNDIAPISLTGATYTQDFNTLANSSTSSILPTGWVLSESDDNANTTYTAGSGSSTAGDTYSFGTGSNTERAFGGLLTGSLIPTIGAIVTNNTGSTITSLNISYAGEQWRLGAAGRTDRLDFQYSLDATNLTSGTWTNVDQLDFISPYTTATGALDGNASANRTVISYTIQGLSIPDGSTFVIRWNDFDVTGSDDGLAIDSVSISANPTDLTPPAVSSLSPSNTATNVSTNVAASITFSENIQKGIGNIVVRRSSDNTIFQMIDVTTPAVTVSSNTASFNLSGLTPNTGYYIEIDNGAFKDVANNNFPGFSGSSSWSFTSGTIFYNAAFNNCTSSPTEGFIAYSVTGPQVWGCTTFGRDAGNPPSGSAPNGVQINGFNVTNIPNEDWLISPSFDLTATNYPLLSFWSRTRFNGDLLQLKVSTNYTSGDPTLATWTDLNGKFPAPTSDVWTLSENINLSAYKTSNVHFAFVYYSTDEEGARWTLDDIQLNNSPTPPPASLTLSSNDLQFGYVAAGGNSVKSFSFTGNDITGDVNITASTGFLLSKDNTTFTSTLDYTQPEANNIPKTVYVRFSPTQNDLNYNGTVTISTPGVTDTVINVKGTSIDPVKTLEVVNWNVEWFGSTANGPVDNNQQEQNVRTILQNIGADIYGLVEVVDEARLANVVSQMPGYAYVISNFGSHTNTSEPGASPLSEAQKLAFVYKTSVFTNVTTTALLSQGINSSADLSNPAYNYYASGRFPYMMTADVTLDGVTRNMKFVLIHAKANTSPTLQSYDRRKRGADTLHYTLSTLYPSENIVLFGDINDDLDSTITDGVNPRITSYISFTNDSVNYPAPTLQLSRAGKKSTVSYNDVIDHVIVSNEMQGYYMNSSANILTDVTSLVTNYASTTSDHYPVFTRFAFDLTILPVSLVNFSAVKLSTSVKLSWVTSQEINTRNFVVEKSADGIHFEPIGFISAAGNSSTRLHYELVDLKPFNGINYYRLKSVDNDDKFTYSKVIALTFTKSLMIKLVPNPARDFVKVWQEGGFNSRVLLRISDMNGRVVKEQAVTSVSTSPFDVNIKGLSPGVYILTIKTGNLVEAEKLIIH